MISETTRMLGLPEVLGPTETIVCTEVPVSMKNTADTKTGLMSVFQALRQVKESFMRTEKRR